MELCDYARKLALVLVLEGLRAVDPANLFMERVSLAQGKLRVDGLEVNVSNGAYLVALGKAGGYMAEALEKILGDAVRGGVATMLRGASSPALRRVSLVVAGHPYPDEGSIEAGKLALKTAEKAKAEGVPLVVLLSGGGSAMAEVPAPGVKLEDLRRLTEQLLKCGATIDEVNTVRKHLSLLKGGRLAAAASPSPVVTLAISDVIGDRLDVIASGPTVPDPTTYDDALNVLKRYNLMSQVPPSIVEALMKGHKGEIPETPKPGELPNSVALVVGSNMTALKAMKRHAESMGLNALILTSMLQGEAREAAKALTAVVLEVKRSGLPVKPPAAVICGGETTVTVRGSGKGGRNQEFALSAALRIAGEEGVAVAAVGSDGIDGPTDVAGAVVDGRTIKRARELGLDPIHYLENNDSYTFFKLVGGHVVTGPTRTNVNDFYIGVVATKDVVW
ncbi:MAG: glycerate kinase [Thermofilaceae archaeon]